MAGFSFDGRKDYTLQLAESAAQRLSDDRYVYELSWIEFGEDWIHENAGERWLELAVTEDAPEVIVGHGWAFRDLAEAGALVNIGPYLGGPTTGDGRQSYAPRAFWPGVLESGQLRGEQLAMPLFLVLAMLIANEETADLAGVALPADGARIDAAGLVDLAYALTVPASVTGSEPVPGFLYRVTADPGSTNRDFLAIGLGEVLASAAGPMPDPDGSYQALRTPAAAAAIEWVRSLAQDPQFTLTASEYRSRGERFEYGTRVNLLQQGLLPSPNMMRVYPYPDFGGGWQPTQIRFFGGVASTANDPQIAFDAYTWLEAGMLDTLFGQAMVPVRRASPAAIQEIIRGLSEASANAVVAAMETPALVAISNRESTVILREVIEASVFGDVPADQALNRAVEAIATRDWG